MKRLFGTDGIRAVAGEPPLDPSTVRQFGAALAEVLKCQSSGDNGCRVVLGRDTRESGPWLRDAVVAGLASRDVDAVDAGVITTPGLAHVLQVGRFQAGVMISASHNPFEDNGLKVFGPRGTKLADETEQEIEKLMLDAGIDDPGESDLSVASDPALVSEYLDYLANIVTPSGCLEGMRLIVDCANGAASELAPMVFRRQGAIVDTIGTEPDGRNINLDCGSLHLDRLARAVVDAGADAGLAFDGDADRCLAVDRKGRVVDGDCILFIIGRRMKQAGRLKHDALVATIMSNFWLEERLSADGVRLHRAPVGDKYVLEKMTDEGLVLGGEQSGHIIFREHASTGDGMLTGLMLLEAQAAGLSIETTLDDIRPYPQVLLNVKVREKPDLWEHSRIGPVAREVEAALDGRGRVVLRYSGTEPKARVMIEGKEPGIVDELASRLAGVIERELG
jgi:phosphoglucosamine mutase